MTTTETETPVSYRYNECLTRYGVITEIIGNRAKVEWQAQCCNNAERFNKRIKLTTTVAISKLSAWTNRIRLNDGITLNPDGLEYYTPKA